MVEASKLLFEKATEGMQCCDLIHPWTKSCINGTCSMLWSSIKGSYKFYAAVYIVQLILKGKKLKKSSLQKQFSQYLLSGVFGFFVGTSFVTFNCILRKLLFDKFHYHGTVFLPSLIAGVGIFFEPPHRRYLIVDTFFNLLLEYWVRTLEFKGIMKRSTILETLVFMFGSGYLFYLMRQEKDKDKKMSLLWFFTPPKTNIQPISNNGYINGDKQSLESIYCPHTGSCRDHILKGLISLFGLGCAMSMLRTVVSKLGTPMKALKSITGKQFNLGLFLGGYIGIYRLVSCILCRRNKKDSAKHALPAGFLAGTAFWLNPNLSISLATITSILHILCSRLYEQKILPENWPLAEMLYAVCQGILFHARVMHPDMCPRYIFNLLDTVTSGKVALIYGNLLTNLVKFC